MAEHTIILVDGSSVSAETTLTISRMRKLQKEGLITKNMLKLMGSGAVDDDIDKYIFEAQDAVYLAYVNANEDDYMSKEEFFDLLPYDLIVIFQIFSEIIGGPTLGSKFAESFKKVLGNQQKN